MWGEKSHLQVAYRQPVNDEEKLYESTKDMVNAHPGCAHWHCSDYNLPDIDCSKETLSHSLQPQYQWLFYSDTRIPQHETNYWLPCS